MDASQLPKCRMAVQTKKARRLGCREPFDPRLRWGGQLVLTTRGPSSRGKSPRTDTVMQPTLRCQADLRLGPGTHRTTTIPVRRARGTLRSFGVCVELRVF